MNPTQVEKDNRVRAKISTILDHLDYHNRHLTNRGLSQELLLRPEHWIQRIRNRSLAHGLGFSIVKISADLFPKFEP